VHAKKSKQFAAEWDRGGIAAVTWSGRFDRNCFHYSLTPFPENNDSISEVERFIYIMGDKKNGGTNPLLDFNE
jgi:hypothetical protein